MLILRAALRGRETWCSATREEPNCEVFYSYQTNTTPKRSEIDLFLTYATVSADNFGNHQAILQHKHKQVLTI
jgi:hypothetical protein